MAAPEVLIVGAGPTGLVLALCLARHGVAFRIIDKSPGPGLASRAIAVQARTLEFYDQLGFAMRYVSLPASILCCAYFAFTLYATQAFSRWMSFTLYSLMALLYVFNAQRGIDYATWRMDQADVFARDIAAGMTSDELAAKHWERFYPSQEGFAFSSLQKGGDRRP